MVRSSPAFDLAQFISSQSELGLVLSQSLFVSLLPQNPIGAVAFIDSGGLPAALNYEYERATVQILVRNEASAASYALAFDIMQILNGLHNLVINNSRYILIQALGSPLSFLDENKRTLHSLNLSIHRTAS